MSTFIGRGTPTADITIAATSYRGQFNFFSIRSVIPQVDSTTFAEEPATAYEATETIYVATFSGYAKQGAGAWTTFFPPPQKVAVTWKYADNATVGGTWSFEDVLAARPVNANATLAGTARSTGVVSITWT